MAQVKKATEELLTIEEVLDLQGWSKKSKRYLEFLVSQGLFPSPINQVARGQSRQWRKTDVVAHRAQKHEALKQARSNENWIENQVLLAWLDRTPQGLSSLTRRHGFPKPVFEYYGPPSERPRTVEIYRDRYEIAKWMEKNRQILRGTKPADNLPPQKL